MIEKEHKFVENQRWEMYFIANLSEMKIPYDEVWPFWNREKEKKKLLIYQQEKCGILFYGLIVYVLWLLRECSIDMSVLFIHFHLNNSKKKISIVLNLIKTKTDYD